LALFAPFAFKEFPQFEISNLKSAIPQFPTIAMNQTLTNQPRFETPPDLAGTRPSAPTSAAEKGPRYMGNLQDHQLEQTAATTLPESMREPFLWLGCYLRDRCNRSTDILETKIAEVGLNTTGSTIGKIINGMWKRDALGQPTAAPILAEKKFLDLVARLRKQDQFASMAGQVPFIETETWDKIREYIDIRRAEARVCKFGLIVGATGSQKTACLKQYALRNNHGKVVHLEAPDSASMSRFITELALAYGVGRNKKRFEKELAVFENVNKTKTIVIDNLQRLFKPSNGWNQPILSFLQKLQDDTGCTIILCCVPESELVQKGHGYFEQFEGRCGGREEFLWLPNFTQPAEIEQIAEAFKLKDAAKHIDELLRLARSRGRIRVLFNVLQLAKQDAEADERNHITIHDVRAVLEEQKLNDMREKKEPAR
jgi:DNA transposition AAA+ family ATPase